MPRLGAIRDLLAIVSMAFLALAWELADPAAAADVAAARAASALVQINPLMVPIAQPGARKPSLKPVTVVVEVGETDAENVCLGLPRIRDAVLVELFRQPITTGGAKGMDVRPVEARLLEPVNRALGSPTIRRIYVIPGADRGAASAAGLPHPVVDCRPSKSRKA